MKPCSLLKLALELGIKFIFSSFFVLRVRTSKASWLGCRAVGVRDARETYKRRPRDLNTKPPTGRSQRCPSPQSSVAAFS